MSFCSNKKSNKDSGLLFPSFCGFEKKMHPMSNKMQPGLTTAREVVTETKQRFKKSASS